MKSSSSGVFSEEVSIKRQILAESRIMHHKNIPFIRCVNHSEMSEKVKHLQPLRSVDKATFEELFKEHYDGMYRYCQTMVNDISEVEDIIQGVFTDLWQDRHKLVIHTSIQAFLYKGVYFKCMNNIKHAKVAQKYVRSTPDHESHMVGDTMIYQEVAEKIDQVMRTLPEQCRKIFAMSRFDGLRYKEIAETLQLSPKTIENQMGKALKTMRVALSEYIHIIVFTILSYLL
ncbi:MAG: RNA polymerase sigma-70 factor [Saprospiraceae bacterium]